MTLRERLSALSPDPRDICFLAGFLLTFVGLYQYRPWLAYTVCGILLMAAAVTMRGSR